MTQAPHTTLASVIIWIYMVLSVSILFHFLLLFLLPMSPSVTALLARDGFTRPLEFFLLFGTHSLRLSIILTLNICFPFSIYYLFNSLSPTDFLKTHHFYSLCLFLHFLSSCLPILLLCCPVDFQLCNFSTNYNECFYSILCDLCYLRICYTYDLWLNLLEIKLHRDRNLCLAGFS